MSNDEFTLQGHSRNDLSTVRNPAVNVECMHEVLTRKAKTNTGLCVANESVYEMMLVCPPSASGQLLSLEPTTQGCARIRSKHIGKHFSYLS